MDTSQRVTARFAPDDEVPIAPPAPSKSKSHSHGHRQVDLTQEAEDDTLNSIMNNAKAKIPEPTREPTRGAEHSEDGWGEADEDEGEDEDDDDMGDDAGFGDPFTQNASEDMVARAEKIKAQKMDLLNKLYRLSQEAGVIVPANLSIKSPLDEIEATYSRITYDLGVRKSIRLQRRMLMGLFSTIEMANDMSGGPDELNGVSRSIFASISDFDGPFTELYELYGSKVKVHPLLQVVMLAGSATAYHCYSKSMAKHQSEQDKAKAQAQATNDPQAALRNMREMELQYAAEERARDARVAANQKAARQKAEQEAFARSTVTPSPQGFQRGFQSGDTLSNPLGAQTVRQIPIVPPPMTAPQSRPVTEYLMKGPMAGNLVGTTTTPGSVGILSEVGPADDQRGSVPTAPVTGLTAGTSEFERLPDDQSEPPTPSGPKKGGRKKASAKKKDADELKF